MRLPLLALSVLVVFPLAAGCSSGSDDTASTGASTGGQSPGAGGQATGGSGASTGGNASIGGSTNAGGNEATGGGAGHGGAGAGGASTGGAASGGAGANGGISGGSGQSGAAGESGAAGAAGDGAGGSSNAGAGGEAGSSDFVTAKHQPLPQLMPHGDTIIKNPQIVTVTFQDFDKTAKMQAFGDSLATSPWLPAVGADYGVGAATHLAKAVIPHDAPATMTDQDLYQLLEKNADGVLPLYGPEVVFLVYLPSTTMLDASAKSLGQSCSDFLGYHDSDKPGLKTLYYAVIMDCDNDPDEDTSTASHELIELASDPTNGWWYEGADDDPLGYIDDGTEAADMCEWYPNVEIGGFAYQRVWSNSAAAAGTSPCIPVPPGEAYRNVSPDNPLMPTLMPGQSTTITLTGWSTLPVPDWTLTVEPESVDGGFTPEVKLSSTKINNGKTVTVTLTVPANAPNQSYGVINIASDPQGAEFWALGVLTP